MSLLEIKNLSVSYSSNNGIKNINLNIIENKTTAIVGESGSGKSTLIKSIMGLLTKETKVISGEILFNAEPLLNKKEKELREIRGKEIGLVFQDAGMYLNPKRKIGKQFIESILSHKKISKEEAYNLSLGALESVNLNESKRIMNSYSHELSGGMKQRVAIAMAIVMKPKILLLDEPTSALDVTIQKEIVNLLMEFQKTHNISIIIVTHDMGVASFMSHNIGVMKSGELIEFGTREQIIYNPKKEYTKKLINSVPKLEDESFVK